MTGRKFDPHKLKNPQQMVDIAPDLICQKLRNNRPATLVEIGAGRAFFCIAFLQQLKPSKIYACDVSDMMSEGPPQAIRCLPEKIKDELITFGFEGISIYDRLPKHILMVGRRAA